MPENTPQHAPGDTIIYHLPAPMILRVAACNVGYGSVLSAHEMAHCEWPPGDRRGVRRSGLAVPAARSDQPFADSLYAREEAS